MRWVVFAVALCMGSFLWGGDWQPWAASTEWKEAHDGFSYIRRIDWKDTSGNRWGVEWVHDSVEITAPDGKSKKVTKPFITANAHHVDKREILHWMESDWECFGVLVGTGRNGIALNYFLIILRDTRSGAWDTGFGRATWDGCPEPSIKGDEVALRWSDEMKGRCLTVGHQWTFRRRGNSISLIKAAPRYRLEYGYPSWFRFVGDSTSVNPDVAEHLGFRSIAWKVVNPNRDGAMADSDRNAIPKDPGKQVWREGTGPDVWFPEVGQVAFRWENPVEIRRFAEPVRKATPTDAARMAATGQWDVVLTKDEKGLYLGAMLVEQKPDVAGENESTGTILQTAQEQRTDKYSDPTGFDFEVKGRKLNLTSKWVLTLQEGTKQSSVTLKHSKHDYIEKVTFTPVQEGVILFLQNGDGDGSGGTVFRLSIPSGKVVWSARIPAFNILGMLQGNNLFVTGIGFVGCINPKTGAFRWKHGDLYDRVTADFNWVEAIRVMGDRVVFVSGRPRKDDEHTDDSTRTLQVDLGTGRVITE